MQKKIEQAVEKFHMAEIYDGAILGFSGGADSSALLYFLKERTKNLLCVHINHMIRGEEAERDERHAEEICRLLLEKLQFVVKQSMPHISE